MNDQPIHYATLRDLDHWDENAKQVGLELQPDGVLMLARVPGTSDGKPIVESSAFAVEASGLAIGDCQDIYVADTTNHRIIVIDRLCDSRTLLGSEGSAPSQFQNPRGLLVVKDNLYVADSGNTDDENGRVQVFRLPSLELRAIWDASLDEPIMLAVDSQGRIYVLDSKLKSVLRFSTWGIPDNDYSTEMANLLNGYTPISLAIDGSDRLYVADEGSNAVLRFDSTNKLLDAIQGDKPARPRAMTAHGNWLYVADEFTGTIWIFDCAAEIFLGTLPDYHGPVSAMAADDSGRLYIKPGLDEKYYVLEANKACVRLGSLTAGPFDAGVGVKWERVHVDVDLPTDTDATLRTFTASDKSANPDWSKPKTLATSLDTLLFEQDRRFLWLRVDLHSDLHHRTSPQLLQVQAETIAQSYMEYLPSVYSRRDAPDHFLEHWLAAFRSELGDLELELEEMPRRFDPLTAPEDHLKWLASWLALDPLPDLPNSELRCLLPRVHQLYERRGTPEGIREFIELYTGVRPALFEAFRERHVWQLGYTSMLGFDTALPDGLPDGMIIPGHTLADPSCQGLRGDYYSGIDFKDFKLTRTDPAIDFEWGENSPDSVIPANKFSVRWTGKLEISQPEDYTFYVLSDDGVRLQVDGNLIIDHWIDQPATEYSGQLHLTAGSHDLVLEYYENLGSATIKLSWSSATRKKEIIQSDFRGEYYAGTNFEKLLLSRTDPKIDFDWGENSPHALVPTNWFSVRWTGQVLPRYSERYTFHALSDDGVRLWVDGILIIDQWVDQVPTEHSGTVELEEGRWYTIQLEYYEKTGGATIKLYWSSRSQPKEIIPQSQLYSVREDGARFELQDNEQPMLVGQTVVGESGPLNKLDFGMPLFSEAAHLFTVIVPAGALPGQAQREMLQQVIEAEKPAHTDYHLCFVEPRMRVGFQARLGIDSIVAGSPLPMELSGATLGLDSYLGEEAEPAGRIGQRARLGQDTRIG